MVRAALARKSVRMEGGIWSGSGDAAWLLQDDFHVPMRTPLWYH